MSAAQVASGGWPRSLDAASWFAQFRTLTGAVGECQRLVPGQGPESRLGPASAPALTWNRRAGPRVSARRSSGGSPWSGTWCDVVASALGGPPSGPVRSVKHETVPPPRISLDLGCPSVRAGHGLRADAVEPARPGTWRGPHLARPPCGRSASLHSSRYSSAETGTGQGGANNRGSYRKWAQEAHTSGGAFVLIAGPSRPTRSRGSPPTPGALQPAAWLRPSFSPIDTREPRLDPAGCWERGARRRGWVAQEPDVLSIPTLRVQAGARADRDLGHQPAFRPWRERPVRGRGAWVGRFRCCRLRASMMSITSARGGLLWP
jgi:hypothetical protein